MQIKDIELTLLDNEIEIVLSNNKDIIEETNDKEFLDSQMKLYKNFINKNL